MTITRRLALVVLGAIALAACQDDADDAASTTASTASTAAPATTSAPAPTAGPASTAGPTTTAGPGATAAPTTAGPSCADTGETATVEDGYPMRMSGLVGADIRTGAHPCFERVVIELEGSGDLPGYRIGYEADPIALSPSDQTVEIAGDATLVVRMASWMTSMEGAGYAGPTEITPTNVEHLLELRMIENFEGMSAWAVGVDQERPFTVTTLDDPPRLVIDVATG